MHVQDAPFDGLHLEPIDLILLDGITVLESVLISRGVRLPLGIVGAVRTEIIAARLRRLRHRDRGGF